MEDASAARPLELLLWYAGGATLALLSFLLVTVASSPLWLPLLHPTPRRGSPATLPNGLEVQQWTKLETGILYDEIWGPEGAYSHGSRVRFAPGMTVVDLGANIGLFSLFAARQCGGHAHVLSIEPIPSTFAVLRDNAALANNGNMDAVLRAGAAGAAAHRGGDLHIVAVNCAVSDVPRGTRSRAVFAHHPNLSIWSTSDAAFASARVDRIVHDFTAGFAKSAWSWLVPPALFRAVMRQLLARHFAATVATEVEVRRTGDILQGILKAPAARIDLLKVDVEGAEIAALRGIEDTQWPRIDQVVMELENIEAAKQAERLLRSKGFAHTDWKLSEREKGAATSEVCLLYASRESDEEVEARLAAGEEDNDEFFGGGG